MPTPTQIKQEIEKLTKVQRLIHLAFRKTEDDVQSIYGMLFAEGRRAYEETLSELAVQIGCSGQSAHLADGKILKELSTEYRTHAVSIVATYNRDLAVSIQSLAGQNIRGNRYYYAKHLTDWEISRDNWKVPQIALMTRSLAQSRAVQDFVDLNFIDGLGFFEGPNDEKTCDICRILLAGNPYSLREFQGIVCPVHVNCRHIKRVQVESLAPNECVDLWVGGIGYLLEDQSASYRLSEEFLQLDWLEMYKQFGDFSLDDRLGQLDYPMRETSIHYDYSWGLSVGAYQGYVLSEKQDYTVITDLPSDSKKVHCSFSIQTPFVAEHLDDIGRKYPELKQAVDNNEIDTLVTYLSKLGYDSITLIGIVNCRMCIIFNQKKLMIHRFGDVGVTKYALLEGNELEYK